MARKKINVVITIHDTDSESSSSEDDHRSTPALPPPPPPVSRNARPPAVTASPVAQRTSSVHGMAARSSAADSLPHQVTSLRLNSPTQSLTPPPHYNDAVDAPRRRRPLQQDPGLAPAAVFPRAVFSSPGPNTVASTSVTTLSPAVIRSRAPVFASPLAYGRTPGQKYMVVTVGRCVGVFDSWLSAAAYVTGLDEAIYQSFLSYQSALNAYLERKAAGQVRIAGRVPGDEVLYGYEEDGTQ